MFFTVICKDFMTAILYCVISSVSPADAGKQGKTVSEHLAGPSCPAYGSRAPARSAGNRCMVPRLTTPPVKGTVNEVVSGMA